MPRIYDNAGRRIVPKRLQKQLKHISEQGQRITDWSPRVGSIAAKKAHNLTIELIEKRGLPQGDAGVYQEVHGEVVGRLQSDLRRLADKIEANRGKRKNPYRRAVDKVLKRANSAARKKPKKMHRTIRP